ncbi:MAG: MFS transporter, partial [Dehalococcoidia bacterium]|nr:MFS transporter [Dehalococcoidia bacterium]
MATLPQARTGLHYGWTIAIAGFVITVTCWGAYYTFGVFFKPLLTEFGWSRTLLSSVVALQMVSYAALAPISGTLSDRYGPRVLQVSAGLIMGLGYLLAATMDSVWQLYLFLGIMPGLGLAGINIPTLTTVPRWFVARRGLVMGLVIAGMGLGTTVTPLLANTLILSWGWRWSYVAFAVIVWLAVIPAGLLMRKEPRAMGLLAYGENPLPDPPAGALRQIPAAPHGISLKQAIRRRDFWMLSGAYCAAFICLALVTTHIVPYASDTGLSAPMAAAVLSLMGAGSIVGRIGLGAVSDRFGRKQTLAASLVLGTLMMVWLTLFKEPWTLYFYAAVFGVSYGGWVALYPSLVGEVFGLASLGAVFGGISMGAGLGSAVGPTIAGYIFDASNSY